MDNINNISAANQNGNLEYIMNLDKKVRKLEDYGFQKNKITGDFKPTKMYKYTNETISNEEIKTVLQILKKENLAIYPINTAMGFAVGFSIDDVVSKNTLLRFKEEQLPVGYKFSRMARYFMTERNLELCNEIGIVPQNDREHYDY
jgi:hypothetical protein